MHIAEQGEGLPVVLCHGFPELWYSWRHQLPALAAAGYYAIAPDQRGYGRTDRPAAVGDYDMPHLTGDLLGLLDAIGEELAVVVGHDWGALVAWELALRAPHRVSAVVGLSVAFTPRSPSPPTELMRAAAGDHFFYILYFQEVGPADRELAEDPRRTIARTLWSACGDAANGSIRRLSRRGTRYLDILSDPPAELPPWLSAADIERYASEFARTGFTGALNWYRNIDRNWEISEGLRGKHVTVPALFVAGERDPVLRMVPPDAMDEWVSDLRGKILIPGAGHWIQQESPQEVNAALIRFLATLPSSA